MSEHGQRGESVTGGVPVTIEDVCRWADAFDAYYESEALAVPDEPSFRAHLDVASDTYLSRWEAHRSVADICRFVRDHLALAAGHAPEGPYYRSAALDVSHSGRRVD